MGSQPRQNYDLGTLIKELTRAAEAVRGMASYLEENPDALLKGRGKGNETDRAGSDASPRGLWIFF